jgi:hypothetical protein
MSVSVDEAVATICARVKGAEEERAKIVARLRSRLASAQAEHDKHKAARDFPRELYWFAIVNEIAWTIREIGSGAHHEVQS